jgi:hypothetical protein
VGLYVSLRCGVILLALRLHHSTIHHLCISTTVARSSNGRYQEKTRHDTETFMFMDNGNGTHCSYGCYGGTHLTTSTRFSGSGRGKISCTLNMESGISYLHTNRCGFRSRFPYLIGSSMLWGRHLTSNSNIDLLSLIVKSGPEDLGFLCI